MNASEQLTVKELAVYCNQLCEEGHGDAVVQMELGGEPMIYDIQLKSCMYELNKLRLIPDPMFRLTLPKSFVTACIYAIAEQYEILKECHEAYLENIAQYGTHELRSLLKAVMEAI